MDAFKYAFIAFLIGFFGWGIGTATTYNRTLPKVVQAEQVDGMIYRVTLERNGIPFTIEEPLHTFIAMGISVNDILTVENK